MCDQENRTSVELSKNLASKAHLGITGIVIAVINVVISLLNLEVFIHGGWQCWLMGLFWLYALIILGMISVGILLEARAAQEDHAAKQTRDDQDET